MQSPLVPHEIDILQSYLLEFVDCQVPFLYLPIVAAAFHVIRAYDLLGGAPKNVLHED